MHAPSLEAALELARINNRVCPKTLKWCALYELLPDTRRDNYGFIPPSPLIDGEWSDDLKRDRLREHLVLAQQHGVLARVYAFLALLPEHEWIHAGI